MCLPGRRWPTRPACIWPTRASPVPRGRASVVFCFWRRRIHIARGVGLRVASSPFSGCRPSTTIWAFHRRLRTRDDEIKRAFRKLALKHLTPTRTQTTVCSGRGGEARQSFRALGALPPLRYRASDIGDHTADPRCTPRGDITHGQLLQMPLLHNPMLDATPAEGRATPAEAREMLRWAGHGVTRVTHVLNATHARVLTFEQLCSRYPNLVGRGATRACVKRMFGSIRTNLHTAITSVLIPPRL
jgi:hypothetical protein